jgi:hypothetical protein
MCQSAVTIVSGKSAGIKTLDIAGDLAALERVLKALI